MIPNVHPSIRALTAIAATVLVTVPVSLDGQSGTVATRAPRMELISSQRLQLTGEVDSNSPAIWDRVNGRLTLFVMTSMSGMPSTAAGRELLTLGQPTPAAIEPWPGGGIWMTAGPIFPAKDSWHDEDSVVDAFWGPSVHWNTYLQQYVMLLNHAKDDNFAQEGIYVSFAADIDDPRLWSPPVKILNGGGWYPQIIGQQDGLGTDKMADQ